MLCHTSPYTDAIKVPNIRIKFRSGLGLVGIYLEAYHSGHNFITIKMIRIGVR